MNEIAKEIIESAINRNKPHNKVLEPKIGDIVLYKKIYGYVPVKIRSGKFYGSNGVSNFWYWENLETHKVECGYGDFYKVVTK